MLILRKVPLSQEFRALHFVRSVNEGKDRAKALVANLQQKYPHDQNMQILLLKMTF